MKKWILLLSLFLLLSTQVWGATYYVKNGGSDAADGLSDGNAWETIAKVNTSGGTGNTIYFKRGSIWRAETITNEGSNTYGAYDTGDKPSIRGSVVDNTASGWTLASGEYWKTYASDPNIVVGDGIILVRGTVEALAAGQYGYSGGNLYLKNNPTSYTTLEVATTDRAWGFIWWDNCTVDNIDFRHFRENIFNSFGGANGWTVSNCSFGPTAKYGIQWNGNTADADLSVSDSTFTDWGVLNGQAYAVQAIAGAGSTGVRLDVTGCTFTINHTQNTTEIGAIYGDDYGAPRNILNNVISNNSGSGAAFKGAGIMVWQPGGRTQSVEISGNRLINIGGIPILLQSLEEYSGTYTVVVKNNYIENANGADTLDQEALRCMDFTTASNVTVHNNVLNGTVDGTNKHSGIRAKGADGVKIWNNTVYGCDDGIEVLAESGDESIGLDIRNNISTGNRGYGLTLEADSTITTWGYNAWYNNTSGNLSGKAAGTGDVTADPLLVSAGTDFHLLAASPAKNAGVSVGLTQDKDGIPVPVGLGVDIGAYEYFGKHIIGGSF